MEKTISIFGSAQPVEGDEEYRQAYEAAAALASAGYAVATGGYGGIMEAASKGASEQGGKVYGVTVSTFSRKPNNYVTDIIACASLFERIENLISIADGFLILRGGTGTMLELAAVWEFSNKSLITRKPVVCCGEFWKPVIEHMEKQLALEKRETGQIVLCNTARESAGFLLSTLEQE